MKVIAAFEVSGRGLGLLLDCEHFDAPSGEFRIEAAYGNTSPRRFTARKEFARKVPPGEVEALFVPDAQLADIPVGSRIRVI